MFYQEGTHRCLAAIVATAYAPKGWIMLLNQAHTEWLHYSQVCTHTPNCIPIEEPATAGKCVHTKRPNEYVIQLAVVQFPRHQGRQSTRHCTNGHTHTNVHSKGKNQSLTSGQCIGANEGVPAVYGLAEGNPGVYGAVVVTAQMHLHSLLQ